MAQVAVGTRRLRRSFSEHVKDSTSRAWDVFWRGVRERRLWEIEAREACDWLRAAGFPQYAQFFRDRRFPVDVERAKRDHGFLDRDALDSLCRRLNTLNRWVETRAEPRRSKRREDEKQEEDFCAISPSWTLDRQTRRWRRLDAAAEAPPPDVSPATDRRDVVSVSSCSSSSESEGRSLRETASTATASTADELESSRSSSRCSSANRSPFSGPPSPGRTAGPDPGERFLEKPPRKTGRSLLKKEDESRLVEPTRPVEEEGEEEERGCPPSLQSQTCDFVSSWPSSNSSSQSESSSAVSTPSPVARVRSNCKRCSSSAGLNSATSRTNRNRAASEEDFRNQINSSFHQNLVFQVPHGHKPGTFPTSLIHEHAQAVLSPVLNTSINWRTGSFHGYWGQRGCRSDAVTGRLAALDHRLSVYDNVPDQLCRSEGGVSVSASVSEAEPTAEEESDLSRLLDGEDVFSALDSVLERISRLQQLVSSWSESLSEDNCQRGSSPLSSSSPSSSSQVSPSSPSHIHLEVQRSEEEVEEDVDVEDGPQPSRPSRRQHWCSQQSLTPPTSPGVDNQSASQFALLQKLALLKLTALMDKLSPSSKQGWSWTVPKPLRKTKPVEVKGRRVFGVPLLASLQQTGEPLPPSILRALLHLRAECLGQVGLFRKSGVKSRIQFLRDMVEADPGGVSFQGQSAFDVADLVKQYFRDLPEPLFTGRLSETFLHIYQYFPNDQQLLAAQAAILLLPDQNREALRALLFFLRDVVSCVDQNQMTPTNVAVCLAPSLFHLNTPKKDARSPGRKTGLGRPDQRDLSENLAATQGLAHMITEAPRLFQLPEFWSPLEDLSPEGPGGPGSTDQRRDQEEEQEQRRRRLQRSTQRLLVEAREKSRGWEGHPVPAPGDVDLAFKKVEDGCPLWMWRGTVDVDATEAELLHRLLRQPELWDRNLRQASVVQTLSKDTEVFHCLLQDLGQALGSRPPQEYLLLRTWQADPARGPLYLSSVSTEHPEVPPQGVRAQVHSCLYLLEPTGARKTRLTHVCRTDTRGRSREWHVRASGHLLASGLLAIRDSFRGGRGGAS